MEEIRHYINPQLRALLQRQYTGQSKPLQSLSVQQTATHNLRASKHHSEYASTRESPRTSTEQLKHKTGAAAVAAAANDPILIEHSQASESRPYLHSNMSGSLPDTALSSNRLDGLAMPSKDHRESEQLQLIKPSMFD